MPNPEELPRIKNKSQQESDAKTLNAVLTHPTTALGVSWFVALGNLNKAVAEIFHNHANYFFLASFILSYLNWMISTVELKAAANKNASKVGNYIYNTFYFLFYFAVGATYVFAGAAMGSVMLVAAMFLDPVVNLVRSIYFSIRADLATDNVLREKFIERRNAHRLVAIFGGLVSAAFVALMFIVPVLGVAPPVALAISIAIGVIGIAITLLPYFVAAYKWFRKTEEKPYHASTRAQVVSELGLDRQPNDVDQLVMVPTIEQGYYQDAVAYAPASRKELLGEIDAHIWKISEDLMYDQNSFIDRYVWSQVEKRENKIKGLAFLKKIIHDIKLRPVPANATAENPHELAGYLFHYTDKNELINKISQLVIGKFPGIFQSFFKDIGRVEACFNSVFLCIIDEQLIIPEMPESTELRMDRYAV